MKNKAIVFTDVRKAEYLEQEISETAIPAGNVLIETIYSLISAGTETACFRGVEIWFKLPRTPGYSCVGRVIGKADNVTDLNVGDLIFCRGQHQKYQYVDLKSNYCKLPEGIDLRYAPFARMFAIAFTSIRMSKIELGDDVLVIGLGLIGNGAAQLAQLQGANVAAMDLSDDRIALAKACGIRRAINSGESPDMTARILEQLDGRKPSTVIDATGVPNVIDKAIDYVAPDGRLILLGSPRGDTEGNITHFQQHIHRFLHRVEVIGAHEQMCPSKQMPYVKHSCERNERICLELLRDGRLTAAPLLTHTVSPADAQAVYTELDRGNPDYVGVLFDWRNQ